MPVLIRGIFRGGGIKDATALPGDVAAGKVFYNNDGRQVGSVGKSFSFCVVKKAYIPVDSVSAKQLMMQSTNNVNVAIDAEAKRNNICMGLIGMATNTSALTTYKIIELSCDISVENLAEINIILNTNNYTVLVSNKSNRKMSGWFGFTLSDSTLYANFTPKIMIYVQNEKIIKVCVGINSTSTLNLKADINITLKEY